MERELHEVSLSHGLHEKFSKQIIRRYIIGLLSIFLVIFLILFYLTTNVQINRKENIKEINRNLATEIQIMDSSTKLLVDNLYNEQPTLDDLSHLMKLSPLDYFNYKTEEYMKQNGYRYFGTINFLKNAFNSNSKLKAVYFRGTDSHESLLFKKEASIRFVKSPQLGIGEITKLDELSKVIAAGSDTKLICLKKELRYNHDLTLLANAYFLFDITEALSTAENQTERNEGHIFLDTSYEVDNKHDSNLLLDQRQVADYRISSYARYPNTFVEFSWIYLGYVIFVIITVLFTLPFIVRKFKQMEGRIGVLFNKINRIKGGDLSDIQVGVVDNNDDPDELSLISANIDEIALRLSSHMKQIYQSQIKQKDYQIQSIRAQINPHFLYNTLEAIRMKALVNNDDSVAEMLLNTATLYREMIKGDDQVTLEAELTFCDAYLRLFEMRFEDSMFYDISYEDQLKNVLIEKFTLQPLIENYIHHGIDQTRNDNFIEIFCYRKNDDLVAVISNNGRSLSANKLTETLKNLEENANCTENMKMTGLFGVDYRLRSRYGQEYGVQLENLEQGIAVTVRIPIINESEVSIHEGTFSR